MKKLLFRTALCLALAAPTIWAQASTTPKVKDAALFQKLESLYNASVTPYPVAENAIKTETQASPFSGCATVNTDGEVTNQGPMNFFKFQLTTKISNGPLSPAIVKSGYLPMENSIKDFRGAFSNGILDLDQVRSMNASFDVCRDGTTQREYIVSIQSGVSADGTTFEQRGACKTGSLHMKRSYKLSGTFMIEKVAIADEKESLYNYTYCWQ